MKRVRCPKCDNYIVFDETKYEEGRQLVFQCAECGKQFAIKLGVSKIHKLRRDTSPEEEVEDAPCGAIHVIENIFHFKQILPLHMGKNIVGKYAKGNEIDCAIESSDPSLDLHHCIITVSKAKNGNLKYVLQDGPSNTGTFVFNNILGDREQRVIENGTLFTLGATSIILHDNNTNE